MLAFKHQVAQRGSAGGLQSFHAWGLASKRLKNPVSIPVIQASDASAHVYIDGSGKALMQILLQPLKGLLIEYTGCALKRR